MIQNSDAKWTYQLWMIMDKQRQGKQRGHNMEEPQAPDLAI
jgi:hypothetical protein